MTLDPRRSCGPVLECRLIGRPPPGVPPGELEHDGAMRIFGVIKVLSDRRRVGKALPTLRKVPSLADDDHQLLIMLVIEFFRCVMFSADAVIDIEPDRDTMD